LLEEYREEAGHNGGGKGGVRPVIQGPAPDGFAILGCRQGDVLAVVVTTSRRPFLPPIAAVGYGLSRVGMGPDWGLMSITDNPPGASFARGRVPLIRKVIDMP
jgi:hypothetical protein